MGVTLTVCCQPSYPQATSKLNLRAARCLTRQTQLGGEASRVWYPGWESNPHCPDPKSGASYQLGYLGKQL